MRLNLSGIASFKSHRHGWGYVMNSISSLHSKSGIILEDFIEKSFSWSEVKIYTRPWIGFIHNPPNIPNWFDIQNSPDNIFKRRNFQESLKHCIGLFTLSDYLKKHINTLTNIPCFSIYHPTELNVKTWNPNEFLKNKTVVQLGYWLRKIDSITQIPKQFKKEWMPSHYEYAIKKREAEAFSKGLCYEEMDKLWKDVHIHKFLSNEEFDIKLSHSVVLCNMYDSSANNTVIECIARNIPIIVNKLPAVVEYLGENYPLYIEKNLTEDLTNDRIIAAFEYLKDMDKEFLSTSYFKKVFLQCLSKLQS